MTVSYHFIAPFLHEKETLSSEKLGNSIFYFVYDIWNIFQRHDKYCQKYIRCRKIRHVDVFFYNQYFTFTTIIIVIFRKGHNVLIKKIEILLNEILLIFY